MKTRIIHTKIYFEDDWFYQLSINNKFLFIYFITNSHVGLTGIYQLANRVILLETGLPPEELINGKKIFEENAKIYFFKDWTYLVNAKKYANYSGGMNEVAIKKEILAIPKDILEYFTNTVSIPYVYPMDTTINKKQEIINNKLEIKNNKGYQDFVKKRKELFKSG